MSLQIKALPDGRAELQFEGGHCISIPLDERTGGILRRILLESESATRHVKGLGTAAKPLQSMVNEWLAAGGRITRPEPKPAPAGSISISIGELFPRTEG